MGLERLENANPLIYAVSSRERINTADSMNESVEDPIDALEIFDLIRDINDPEHPYTLEQLNVVQEELIKVYKDSKHTYVDVRFTPTIPHCSMATLIGLAIRVKLYRSLHPRIKEAINRQLADKERVAAAMENTNLMFAVNRCLALPVATRTLINPSLLSSAHTLRHFCSKSKSNTMKYLRRQMTDEFSVKAREHSYRCSLGITVLDVGCAPGSWSQVVVERCQLNTKTAPGYLLGIDVQVVSPIPGADILSMSDITSPKTHELIAKKLGGRFVDVVLSDMAPSPTGDNATDHLRLTELCRTLSNNGKFLCKMWDGSYRQSFMLELLTYFKQVRTVKPKSSRDSSAELYLLCTGRNK
uniref:FtsJ domain-containing protein n=1 Tax=Angiostrongylus cantonensis TaxID=6313 RepID=A0A0K0CTD5_ANGCA